MNFENGARDDGNAFEAAHRPQPQHRVSLTVAVVDPQALWAAAVRKLILTSGMTLDDILGTIGPQEDPDLGDCIAALTQPSSIPGCIVDDFWIDSLNGCPPRVELATTAQDYAPVPAITAARRSAHARRPAMHLSLCPPPRHGDASAN